MVAAMLVLLPRTAAYPHCGIVCKARQAGSMYPYVQPTLPSDGKGAWRGG